MFEADSQLKLLPPSIFDIYKVFEHIDMLSIYVVNLHTVAALNIVPTLHGGVCRRPSGPKPEMQHNRRRRGMPTLT